MYLENRKEIGWLKKKRKLVDHERYKSVRIENFKECALKIEKKWVG